MASGAFQSSNIDGGLSYIGELCGVHMPSDLISHRIFVQLLLTKPWRLVVSGDWQRGCEVISSASPLARTNATQFHAPEINELSNWKEARAGHLFISRQLLYDRLLSSHNVLTLYLFFS
jgi:hypothetical protein